MNIIWLRYAFRLLDCVAPGIVEVLSVGCVDWSKVVQLFCFMKTILGSVLSILLLSVGAVSQASTLSCDVLLKLRNAERLYDQVKGFEGQWQLERLNNLKGHPRQFPVNIKARSLLEKAKDFASLSYDQVGVVFTGFSSNDYSFYNINGPTKVTKHNPSGIFTFAAKTVDVLKNSFRDDTITSRKIQRIREGNQLLRYFTPLEIWKKAYEYEISIKISPNQDRLYVTVHRQYPDDDYYKRSEQLNEAVYQRIEP